MKPNDISTTIAFKVEPVGLAWKMNPQGREFEKNKEKYPKTRCKTLQKSPWLQFPIPTAWNWSSQTHTKSKNHTIMSWERKLY